MRRGRKWERRPPGAIPIGLLALVIFLLLSPSAHAHRVYVFAWIEGDMVHTESYLGGKKRAAGGKIEVFDLSGNRLVQGETDTRGMFSFPFPKKGDLRIVLEAGMGHRAEYLLKPLDAESTGGAPSTARKKQDPAPQSPSVQVDRAEIREVVEAVLDAKLAPIKKQLAHMQKERAPGFREIVAGIGYIFGIMGLVLYIRGRKGQKPQQDQR